MQAGCCCGIPCGITVTYPQDTEQKESDFYYALNTPSNQTFYNPVTGLTMLYTDTTDNLGPLDEVGIVMLMPTSICIWTELRYGTGELQAFIRRGHTVGIAIEVQGAFNCFDLGDKGRVDGWLTSLGAADIAIVRANLHVGCQTVTNNAAPNSLNDGIANWRTGGSSYFTLTGNAVAVVEDTSGATLVAAVVSTISGNSNNGKVLTFGDDNTFNTCLTGVTLQTLYDNVCAIIGQPIT